MPNARTAGGRGRYSYRVPKRIESSPAVGGGPAWEQQQWYNQRDEPLMGAAGLGFPVGAPTGRQDAVAFPATASELKRAVEAASSGDVIHVLPHLILDLTAVEHPITVPEGVTVASNRELARNRRGARLRVTKHPKPDGHTAAVFECQQGSRITGLAIDGNVTKYQEWNGYGNSPIQSAIAIEGDGVEIDNCSIRGFPLAAVEVGWSGARYNWHVHDCDLVDNIQDGFGYGVDVHHGNGLIQRNYMDNNRHSISADGYKDCSYVARFNLVGPRTQSHAFDMHAANENASSAGHQGGKRVSIWGNEFLCTQSILDSIGEQEAIRLRGNPTDGGQILMNKFAHPEGRYTAEGPGASGHAVWLSSGADSFGEGGVNVDQNISNPAASVEDVVGLRPSLLA